MADLVQLVGGLGRGALSRCHVPDDLESVVDRGDEDLPRDARATRTGVEAVWQAIEALYRSGVHPAIQVCIRRGGAVALNRAIGHARGNAPDDAEDARKVPISTRTPVNLFSAAKAVTAMLIHKLDEQGALHIDDRVCDYIPEFAKHGKERITIRHVLAHRAGISNLPADAMNLELLSQPKRVLEALCDLRPASQAGQLLAYHAVSGGFVLAEIARRVTGKNFQEICERELRKPLGLEWLHYGVGAKDVARVAQNAFTGPPLLPPVSTILTRALGTDLKSACEMSNDPRFIRGLIPSANLLSTASDVATFYQCLLDDGSYGGAQIFEPRTIHHAIDQQSTFELDLTFGLPIAYSSGFMVGNSSLSVFGWNHPNIFGHLGLTNILCWADPDRDLACAILTTGKPVLSLHAIRLAQVQSAIHSAFAPVARRSTAARRRSRLRAVATRQRSE